ncbi:hypothetical protein VT84_12095 [Gemmata sp. SH-PL17]|uniref:hypothetical protein n=1 Tax=Gemmata sp. SH-PL17 TaxID=1630693 RepID=UPI00078DA783|nr:hypothetical protein [Gemmata sp. SH-PL17]AMV25130.1 hypothetical protein VT84_12095 [Gemmata sp. SH-PL17]
MLPSTLPFRKDVPGRFAIVADGELMHAALPYHTALDTAADLEAIGCHVLIFPVRERE